jgi:hypothetical protein
MTTLTMRMIKGDFVVTGPDVEPMKFKSRPEARDWCKTHHPGSPITEIGPGGKRGACPARVFAEGFCERIPRPLNSPASAPPSWCCGERRQARRRFRSIKCCFVLLPDDQPLLGHLEEHQTLLWIIFLHSGAPILVRKEIAKFLFYRPCHVSIPSSA